MSDQDWIIADLNKQRIAQGEQMAELRAEIARLRDIINPGQAAAYEEGMAALEEKAAILKKENLYLRNHQELLQELLDAGDNSWWIMDEPELLVRIEAAGFKVDKI